MNIVNALRLVPEEFQAYDGQGMMAMRYAFPDLEGTGKSQWTFFAVAEVPVGSSVGFHKHEGADEWFYILSGRATVTIDGEQRQVASGDIVLTQDGSSHGISDVTEPLVFIAIEVKTA